MNIILEYDVAMEKFRDCTNLVYSNHNLSHMKTNNSDTKTIQGGRPIENYHHFPSSKLSKNESMFLVRSWS